MWPFRRRFILNSFVQLDHTAGMLPQPSHWSLLWGCIVAPQCLMDNRLNFCLVEKYQTINCIIANSTILHPYTLVLLCRWFKTIQKLFLTSLCIGRNIVQKNNSVILIGKHTEVDLNHLLWVLIIIFSFSPLPLLSFFLIQCFDCGSYESRTQRLIMQYYDV